jgi:hypothetical protein
VLLGALPGVASAVEPRPISEGGMSFGTIKDASAPEEYAFTLDLSPQLHLEQIDEQTVGAFYPEGTMAWKLEAGPAHAADGATVPTDLAITGPAEVTLTVHHRDGNIAAGGVPFVYPISEGSGWEGGFQTSSSEMNEPKPAAAPPADAPAPPPHVFVTRSLTEGTAFYRPRRFLLSADGSFGVGAVKWLAYGGAAATATGRAFVDDCDPDCAHGRFMRPRAKLRLSKVVECGGRALYARLSYRLLGPVPAGLPRRGSLSMLPRAGDGSIDC